MDIYQPKPRHCISADKSSARPSGSDRQSGAGKITDLVSVNDMSLLRREI